MQILTCITVLMMTSIYALLLDKPTSDQHAVLASSPENGEIISPDEFSKSKFPGNVENNLEPLSTPTVEAQSRPYYIDPNTLFAELCGNFFKAACCIGNQLPIALDKYGNPIGQGINDAINPSSRPDISDLCVWYDYGDPYCDDFIIDTPGGSASNSPAGNDSPALPAIVCCGSIKIRPEGLDVGQERINWPYLPSRTLIISNWPSIPWSQKKTPGLGIDCHGVRQDKLDIFRNQIQEQGTKASRRTGDDSLPAGSVTPQSPEQENMFVNLIKLLPLLLRAVQYAL